MRAIALFLFLLAMSIVPVFADENAPAEPAANDAVTRYHDAYVLEVVDGKIADAAKVYLALMDSEATPPRIRQESQFRFAVCAVLLGRVDEARAQLAALLAKKDLPEAVRARAQTYRESLSDVGVGSAIDKRMQDLVFRLAKQPANNNDPAEYREFEVIGTRAIPFLKKLLGHSDHALRHHAYRMLIRAKEPGIVTAWEPWMWLEHTPLVWNLATYFQAVPGSQEAFEHHVLALGKTAIRTVGRAQRWQNVSVPFIRKFIEAGGHRIEAIWWLCNTPSDEGDALLATWLDDKTDAQRGEYLRLVASRAPNRPVAVQRFPEMVRVSVEALKDGNAPSELTRMAKHVSTDGLCAAAQVALALAQPWPKDKAHFLLQHNGFRVFAEEIESRTLSKAEAATALDVMERVAAHLRQLPRLPNHASKPILACVLHVLSAAAPERATQCLERLFTSDASRWTSLFQTAPKPDWVLAAAQAAPTDAKAGILLHLPLFANTDTSLADRRKQIDAVLGLLPTLSEQGIADIAAGLGETSRLLDPAGTKVLFERVLAVAQAMTSAEHRQKLEAGVYHRDWQYTDHMVNRALPYLETNWEGVTEDTRGLTLAWAVKFGTHRETGPDEREAIRAFLLRHKGEIPAHGYLVPVAAAGDRLLRPIEWIPLAVEELHHNTIKGKPASRLRAAIFRVPADRRHLLARNLLSTSPIAPTAIHFALRFVDDATATANIEKLLASRDPSVRRSAIHYVQSSGSPATPGVLARTLKQLMAEDPSVDRDEVRKLVSVLSRVQPTTDLLPIVTTMLASSNNRSVRSGMTIAKRLGSESLIPPLRALLHSMDEGIRTQAKNTIDELLKLRALRKGE